MKSLDNEIREAVRTGDYVRATHLKARAGLDLLAVVRAHAVEHYEEDGWDFVVECWSDDEIREVVGRAYTEEEAIALMGEEVGPLDDYRKDIQGA